MPISPLSQSPIRDSTTHMRHSPTATTSSSSSSSPSTSSLPDQTSPNSSKSHSSSPVLLPTHQHHMVTQSQHNIYRPKILRDDMLPWHKTNTVTLHASPPESPSSVAEALKYPERR